MTTEVMAKKKAYDLNEKGDWLWKSEYLYDQQTYTTSTQFNRTVLVSDFSAQELRKRYRALLLEQLKDY